MGEYDYSNTPPSSSSLGATYTSAAPSSASLATAYDNTAAASPFIAATYTAGSPASATLGSSFDNGSPSPQSLGATYSNTAPTAEEIPGSTVPPALQVFSPAFHTTLKGWVLGGQYSLSEVVYDGNVIKSATVTWPDHEPGKPSQGTYTALVYDVDQGTTDSFSITYDRAGLIVYQLPIQRDSEGKPTNEPALTVTI